MKRVILDTNIYEFVLKEIDRDSLKKSIVAGDLIIYGNDIIRRELRDIPKYKLNYSGENIQNLRITLLSLYDLLVGKHHYMLNVDIEFLADKYSIAFRALGGKIPRNEILNDFLIVACASVNNLDLVVSEDRKTMLSEISINSYKSVNGLYRYKMPEFIRFEKFKKLLRGVNLD